MARLSNLIDHAGRTYGGKSIGRNDPLDVRFLDVQVLCDGGKRSCYSCSRTNLYVPIHEKKKK